MEVYVAQVCAPTFDRVPRYENKKPMNGSSLPKRSCEWRVEGCLAYTRIHGCGNILFQLAAPSSVPIVPILMTSYNIISYYQLCLLVQSSCVLWTSAMCCLLRLTPWRWIIWLVLFCVNKLSIVECWYDNWFMIVVSDLYIRIRTANNTCMERLPLFTLNPWKGVPVIPCNPVRDYIRTIVLCPAIPNKHNMALILYLMSQRELCGWHAKPLIARTWNHQTNLTNSL